VTDSALILLVDDYDEGRELTADFLISAGYEVVAVADAAAALEAAGHSPHGFRLLITDVNLRGMSGLELAQAVHQISPELPVLYVSGEAVPPSIPPDDVLLKPFEFAVFSAKVRELIARSEGGAT